MQTPLESHEQKVKEKLTYVQRVQKSSGLTHHTLHSICDLKYVCYMQYVGQRVTMLPVLFQPYPGHVLSMTFHYLTVSCIPATGHVLSMTFHYLTVSCIPAIGNLPNISRYGTQHSLIH